MCCIVFFVAFESWSCQQFYWFISSFSSLPVGWDELSVRQRAVSTRPNWYCMARASSAAQRVLSKPWTNTVLFVVMYSVSAVSPYWSNYKHKHVTACTARYIARHDCTTMPTTFKFPSNTVPTCISPVLWCTTECTALHCTTTSPSDYNGTRCGHLHITIYCASRWNIWCT